MVPPTCLSKKFQVDNKRKDLGWYTTFSMKP